MIQYQITKPGYDPGTQRFDQLRAYRAGAGIGHEITEDYNIPRNISLDAATMQVMQAERECRQFDEWQVSADPDGIWEEYVAGIRDSVECWYYAGTKKGKGG
jgi:hypothetical protein